MVCIGDVLHGVWFGSAVLAVSRWLAAKRMHLRA